MFERAWFDMARSESDGSVAVEATSPAPKRQRPDVAARRARNKAGRLCVVKVGLGALGASPKMRAAIEDAAQRTQRIVYEAALLANCAVVLALERGDPVPPVHEQNFWNRCLSQCSVSGAASSPKSCGSEEIARAFREVYHPARGDHAPFESSAGLSMLLTDNALTMVTNATTMVATTFHNRLRQCLGREIDLCAHRRGAVMDRTSRGAWLRVALRRAVDPSDATPWPEAGAWPELQTALGARLGKWHDRFGTALPCKTPQQVQKPHVPVLVGWLYEMRAHLDECLAAVPEEDRSRVFARGGLKTFGLLPLATPRAKHVQASPIALYCSKTSSPSRTVRARAANDGPTASQSRT